MRLNSVIKVQLDMTQDEAYSLWCLLDEAHSAGELAMPPSLTKLGEELKDMFNPNINKGHIDRGLE